MSDTEKAPVICRVSKAGLVPVSPFDAEQLDHYPIGAEVRVRITRPRSLPQHRAYWEALGRVVEATGIAPTAEHLHRLLKADLGYVVPVRNFNGKLEYWPDSTAFDSMDQQEFKEFFDAAMARLAEVTGCDPLDFLEKAA